MNLDRVTVTGADNSISEDGLQFDLAKAERYLRAAERWVTGPARYIVPRG